jgi:selenide,water dikinase
MLPGTLAGQFSPDQMEIDLASLAKRSGARLVVGEVVDIDFDRQEIQLVDGEPIRFDALSVGVGSIPAGRETIVADQPQDTPVLVPIKPMQLFLKRLDTALTCLFTKQESDSDEPLRIAIVGGGVASIELAFCLQTRLARSFPTQPVSIEIVCSDREIAKELLPSTRHKLQSLLRKRFIHIEPNFRVEYLREGKIVAQSATSQSAGVQSAGVQSVGVQSTKERAADLVLWATGAAPSPLVSQFDLPHAQDGFLATDRSLQSTSGRPVFVVGDSGTIESDPCPKAGVYAVRQAPVLWNNLKAILANQPLMDFNPQSNFLKLLNTGDSRALMEYRGWSFHARWCWWLKCWIDRQFIREYQSEHHR